MGGNRIKAILFPRINAYRSFHLLILKTRRVLRTAYKNKPLWKADLERLQPRCLDPKQKWKKLRGKIKSHRVTP